MSVDLIVWAIASAVVLLLADCGYTNKKYKFVATGAWAAIGFFMFDGSLLLLWMRSGDM